MSWKITVVFLIFYSSLITWLLCRRDRLGWPLISLTNVLPLIPWDLVVSELVFSSLCVSLRLYRSLTYLWLNQSPVGCLYYLLVCSTLGSFLLMLFLPSVSWNPISLYLSKYCVPRAWRIVRSSALILVVCQNAGKHNSSFSVGARHGDRGQPLRMDSLVNMTRTQTNNSITK